MALGNILGITDSAELARAEEKISKKKALELFETGLLDTFPVGDFEGLAMIHRYLFEDIYAFAGKMRDLNIAKGNFRFAPLMYLRSALDNISHMPQSSFEEIIEEVWRFDEVPTYATVRTYIKNLRSYGLESLIENIKGVGYRFKCA